MYDFYDFLKFYRRIEYMNIKPMRFCAVFAAIIISAIALFITSQVFAGGTTGVSFGARFPDDTGNGVYLPSAGSGVVNGTVNGEVYSMVPSNNVTAELFVKDTMTPVNGAVTVLYPNGAPWKALFTITGQSAKDYILKATYDIKIASFITQYKAQVVVHVVGPADPGTEIFTGTDNGTPDSGGNVFIPFDEAGSSSFTGGTVTQVWKDGAHFPFNLGKNIMTQITDSGEYMIYYDANPDPNITDMKWVRVWVGSQTSIGEEIFTVGGVIRPVDDQLNIYISTTELNNAIAGNWAVNYVAPDKYDLLQIVNLADNSYLGASLDGITVSGNYAIFYKYTDENIGVASIHTVRVYVINIVFTGYNRRNGAGYLATLEPFAGTPPDQKGFLRNNDRILVECAGITSTDPITIFIRNEAANAERTVLTATKAAGATVHSGTFIVNTTASVKGGANVKVINEDNLKPFLVPLGTPQPMIDASIDLLPLPEMAGSPSIEIDVAEFAILDATYIAGTDAGGNCVNTFSPVANDIGTQDGVITSFNNIGFETPAINHALVTSFACNNQAWYNNAPNNCSSVPETNSQRHWKEWVENTGGSADFLFISSHGTMGGIAGGAGCPDNRCFLFENSASIPTDCSLPYLFSPFVNYDNNLDIEWIIVNACSVLGDNVQWDYTNNHQQYNPTGNITITARSAPRWGNVLLPIIPLPQPDPPLEYNNPIHGIIGFRGYALAGTPGMVATENFITDVGTGETVITSWLNGCIQQEGNNLTYQSDGMVKIGTKLNSGVIVRGSNVNDRIEPYPLTSTNNSYFADNSSAEYEYYYIDYSLDITGSGNYAGGAPYLSCTVDAPIIVSPPATEPSLPFLDPCAIMIDSLGPSTTDDLPSYCPNYAP